MVWMPLALRRFSVWAPMPGRSRRVSWREGFGEDVEGEGDEAVGLFHVAGDFGEIAVGGEADGAAQHGSDALADCSP